MTARVLALTALLLASACSPQAPVANGAANQAAPAPAAPATQTPNAAATSDTKPQPRAANDAGKDADARTDDVAAAEASDGDDDDAVATPAPRRARGCAAELSLGAAEELVRVCQEVSPATHPPCNIQNSCATIRQEINRSCRLLGDDAPEDCRGG